MGILKRQLRQAYTAVAKNRVAFSIYLALFAGSVFAQAEDLPKAKSPTSLFFGECLLETDPAASAFSPGLLTCVKATAGVLARTDSDYQQNSWDYFGSIYSGLHWSELLSAHVRGNSFATRSTVEKGKTNRPISELDELSVRIGNRALHESSVTLGYQDMPFGLNLNPSGRLRSPDPQQSFWKSERLGAFGTWQKDFDLRVDLGLSTKTEPLGTKDLGERKGALLRVTRAISALDGTQFLFSGYAQTSGMRRFGVAMLNSSRRGEQTGLEWIREISLPGSEPFRQIIRISYAGARIKKSQWILNYDNVVREQRSGEISNNNNITDEFALLLALKYTASDLETVPSHWTVTTGMAANL